jgi:alpha-N-arabinofuranosidase
MRAFDKKLELIVCGSSHADMPTYPDWEREVLEHTYENVDHISLHMYFANRENEQALLDGAGPDVLAKNTPTTWR